MREHSLINIGDEPDENGNLREKIVRQRRGDVGYEIH